MRTPLDLAVMALPMLRPLRMVTAVTVLNRQPMRSPHRRVARYTTGTTALIGLSSSLAVLDAERAAPGATITTFQDAAWWTLTIITTIGDGDRYPITGRGAPTRRCASWPNCGTRSSASGRRALAFQRPVGRRSLTDPRGCGRTGVCVTHSRA